MLRFRFLYWITDINKLIYDIQIHRDGQCRRGFVLLNYLSPNKYQKLMFLIKTLMEQKVTRKHKNPTRKHFKTLCLMGSDEGQRVPSVKFKPENLVSTSIHLWPSIEQMKKIWEFKLCRLLHRLNIRQCWSWRAEQTEKLQATSNHHGNQLVLYIDPVESYYCMLFTDFVAIVISVNA